MQAIRNEDCLDRIPGFRNWKLVSIFATLICLGLLVVGAATNNIGVHASERKNYVFEKYALVDQEINKEIATSWTMVHFLGYFIASLIFPDSWAVIWLWGLGWELFESCIKWQNWQDLISNTIGIALGVLTRKLLIPAGQKLEVYPQNKKIQ